MHETLQEPINDKFPIEMKIEFPHKTGLLF